jgi:transposase
MRHARTLDVGLDVPNESMAVASVATEPEADVIDRGTIGTRHADSAPLVRPLQAKAQPLVIGDEAGPCGSWLSRDLTNNGQGCWVVAPALLPTQAGDRVNTDRRDAGPLARLLRSGALTPVAVPAVEDDALRDRSRAREAAIGALQAATCRLNAVVLRHALRATGRATWGPAPLRGRADGVWATPAPQLVFQADVRAVHEPTERLPRVAQARREQVQAWRRQPVGEALAGLRGVPCPVAVTLGAARGDLTRVAHPRHVLTSLGPIPSAASRGARRRQGASPTPGHPHARRALVEGAWASRSPATVRRHWHRRLDRRPTPSQDSRWQAHVRRCPRSRRVLARGPHANHVVVARARALAGFLWAIATQVSVTPSPSALGRHGTRHAAGVPPALGRGAAPVGCHPRRRDETGRHPRASRAAGTRRMPVRWKPTHGSPRDPPSPVTGSASSTGPHQHEDLNMQNTS